MKALDKEIINVKFSLGQKSLITEIEHFWFEGKS